jgi:effector-binding domain-containing protein
MTETTVVEHQEQPVAVLREEVPMTELTEFFARAFGTVAAALPAQHRRIVGPPFAKYHGTPGATVDVAAGFPVDSPVAAGGEVRPDTLPAGRVYEAVHIGPYDKLEQTYSEIAERMAADDERPAEVMWEYYLSGPEEQPDPTQWRTRVCWPTR